MSQGGSCFENGIQICTETTEGKAAQFEHNNSNANPDAVESITPGVEPTSKNTLSSGTCVKVLGIGWNEISDKICYDLGELVEYAKSLPPTKRFVLKLSAKIFYPIDLFTPFMDTMKMLFQTLCTTSMNCDDELEGRTLVS